MFFASLLFHFFTFSHILVLVFCSIPLRSVVIFLWPGEERCINFREPFRTFWELFWGWTISFSKKSWIKRGIGDSTVATVTLQDGTSSGSY